MNVTLAVMFSFCSKRACLLCSANSSAVGGGGVFVRLLRWAEEHKVTDSKRMTIKNLLISPSLDSHNVIFNLQ